MLSIIIPTYNRKTSTHRAVESVLSQGMDVEIIVVDDASNEPYAFDNNNIGANPNVKIITKQENKGAAAARNTGIEAASRELIGFLDSDDYLLENTLSKRLEFALDAGIDRTDGKFKIIGCGWNETDTTGKIVNIRYPKSTTSSDDLFSGCWFCPGSAIIMNRSLFTKTNIFFDENLERLEDLDLFMRLGQAGASYLSQPLLGVSISASDSRYPDVIIEACNAMEVKHFGSGSALDANQRARLKAYLFYELSRAHITQSEYHRALDYLIKSFIQRPRLSLYPGPGWTKSPV